MLQRLVFARMNIRAHEDRPLFREIYRAVDYLERECDQEGPELRRLFTNALVIAATTFQNHLRWIIDCLAIPSSEDFSYWNKNASRYIRTRDKRPCEGPRPIVQFLLPNQAIYADPHKETALIAALLTKRWDLAKVVLNKGADGLKKTRAFGVPLQVATAVNAQEIVKMILAEVPTMSNAATDHFIFPLIERPYECALEAASGVGNESLVRVILEASGFTPASEGQLDSSILSAAENGHEGIVLLLLKHRLHFPPPRKELLGSFLARSQKEPRMLHRLIVAASRGNCPAVLEMAINRCAEEGRGWIRSPFKTALDNGLTDVAQLLLSRSAGGQPNLLDKYKDITHFALSRSISLGRTHMVRWLLDNGAKINLENCTTSAATGDINPFCLASWKGRYEIVSLFLSRGAEPHLHVCGAHSLAFAACHGHHRVVRLLLGAGVNPEQALHVESEWRAAGISQSYLPYSGRFNVATILKECAF